MNRGGSVSKLPHFEPQSPCVGESMMAVGSAARLLWWWNSLVVEEVLDYDLRFGRQREMMVDEISGGDDGWDRRTAVVIEVLYDGQDGGTTKNCLHSDTHISAVRQNPLEVDTSQRARGDSWNVSVSQNCFLYQKTICILAVATTELQDNCFVFKKFICITAVGRPLRCKISFF